MTLDDPRYDGGVLDQTSLLIKSVIPNDAGRYKCILENSVGESDSDESIDISVLCE